MAQQDPDIGGSVVRERLRTGDRAGSSTRHRGPPRQVGLVVGPSSHASAPPEQFPGSCCVVVQSAWCCAAPLPLRSLTGGVGEQRSIAWKREALARVLYYLMKWVFIGPVLKLFFRPEVEGIEH